MSLPDPAASRAVLIGTAHYPHDDALEDLNAVTANVIDFERLLRDAVFAAYTKHCMLVYDPETAVDLAKPVDQAATEAEDLLLIYYAGHGLLDKRMALHLGVKRSTRRYTRFDSFDYEGMRELLALSQARKKILILDCCFSGRAIGAMGGDADIATADIDAPGTYILTATSSTKPAHAPPGAEFTAFTKQLLSVLTDGIDDGPELLGLDDVYRTVRSRLMAEGFPEPQRRSTNAASGLDLVQNPALLRDTSDEATPTWDADADEGADELARQESHPEKTIENAPPGTPEDPELKRDHPEIWLALEQAMTLDDLQVLVSASDLGARVAHERLARALVRISDGTGTALAELVGAVVAAERTAEDSRASAAVQAVRDRWSEVETSLREVSAKVAELQVKQDEQIAVEQSVRDKVETLRSNREILRADLGAELASNPQLVPPGRRRAFPRKVNSEQRRIDELGTRIEDILAEQERRMEDLGLAKRAIEGVVVAKKRCQLQREALRQKLTKLEAQGSVIVASDRSRFPEFLAAQEKLGEAQQRLEAAIATEVAANGREWLDPPTEPSEA